MARFFVSHKESDVELAEAAVNLILESFQIENEDVFCSSVPGHSLGFGKTIESQLKEKLGNQDVLFVLLTLDSIKSTWVLFELGAAWGLDRLVIPVLGPGVTYKDLPGSLSLYPCISINEPEKKTRARIEDALLQIAKAKSIQRKPGGRQVTAVAKLMDVLRLWKPAEKISEKKAANICPDGYQIFQTSQGFSVFRSFSEPAHCVCPACFSKENKMTLLQGDLDTSIQLRCNVCGAVYRLKAVQATIQSTGRRNAWMDGYLK